MPVSLIEKNKNIVELRFLDFLLSEKVALAKLGLLQQQKTADTKRELLEIEAKAQEKKQQAQQTAEGFQDYINEYYHEAVFTYLDERSTDQEYVFNELLTVDPNISKLFDASVTKAASASQFDELIKSMPWLTKGVLNLVNNPPFREQNSQRPYVEDTSLAVRYVGVDNIKYALLTYTARQWLPHSTEPFSDFKTRYWQYSLACGNCMRVLAKHHKVNETLAFIYGMTHGIGVSLSLRMYLRALDPVRIKLMKKALADDRKDIEKVLHELPFDDKFVGNALAKYSAKMSLLVYRQLKTKFAILQPAAEEFANDISFDNMGAMSQALQQAKTYVEYKMLQKARLIELDEAKLFLSAAKINNNIIGELNQVNLTKLNLKPTE